MARSLIKKNYKALELLANQLLEKEVIDADELKVLMKKSNVKKTEPFKNGIQKKTAKKISLKTAPKRVVKKKP